MPFSSRVYFLDENIPKKVLAGLRNAGYSATRVLDEKLRGQPDSTIFAHARACQMTIITFDTDYLSATRFPPPHDGILVIRFFPRQTPVSEIVEAIIDAIVDLEAHDISDSVYTIEPDGVHKAR